MPMAMFHSFFPKLAEDECRYAILEKVEPPPPGSDSADDDALPPGKYAFTEMYCDEPDCDCQRVAFMIFSSAIEGVVATISFGWRPDDPMPGPFLDPINAQSKYAKQALDLLAWVLEDKQYVARLERHYRMVKEAIKNPSVTSLPWWKKKRKRPKK